jgi:hypothetical protein
MFAKHFGWLPHGSWLRYMMTSCGFKSLVGSPCGSSKYQKHSSESTILLKCTKDIKGHLKRLNTYGSDLENEAVLILARAGKL